MQLLTADKAYFSPLNVSPWAIQYRQCLGVGMGLALGFGRATKESVSSLITVRPRDYHRPTWSVHFHSPL